MSLVGVWTADESDPASRIRFTDVALDFRSDGTLLYTTRHHEKLEIIRLRYHIEGTTIVTDQPSAPRIEKTKFSIDNSGVLTLEYNGVPYRFRRQ